MRVTVSGITSVLFDKHRERKTYQRLIERGTQLQPHFNEPEIRQQFCIFLGKYIVKTFKQAIRQQALFGEKFSDIYPPLSQTYNVGKGWAKGKNKVRAVNTKDKFYIESKWLYDHFKYWIKNEEVFIGFHKVTRHPSGPNAQQLLSWLDNGTYKMQARPLVSLIVDEISNDFDRFVDMYLDYVENRIIEVDGTIKGADRIMEE